MHLAYYCSGHGFGHATRVIAVTEALLAQKHAVSIVTNAPERIFSSVIAAGARYRNAEIDAGIHQPKAYDVDRRKTLDGLQRFLQQREAKLAIEVQWLQASNIQAVIADAPFLACAAAAEAGLPSVIISNFSFDSCYSYLSAPAAQDQSNLAADDEPDEPLDPEELRPLVEQTIKDYSNASLLLRLPGIIPFPAFDTDVPMPASCWIDRGAKRFTAQVEAILSSPASKRIIDVPLISRLPSSRSRQPQFRSEFLTSLGVPQHQQDESNTNILLVSFGGQNIPRPGSRPPSPVDGRSRGSTSSEPEDYLDSRERLPEVNLPAAQSASGRPPTRRMATTQHLYLPGAPPALTHNLSRQGSTSSSPEISTQNGFLAAPSLVPHEELLPAGWIALVCGLKASEADEPLPAGFYACPPDVYVPDLCTVCDALLGKLGYGTCSETISAQLPFIFVPRPMFVEEYGLKRLTETRNTLVEMDRDSFEAGRWASCVEQAFAQHQKRKAAGQLWKEEEGVDAGKVIVRHLEEWFAGQKRS